MGQTSCSKMTGAMLSETLYSPDNILIESALPYSGTLRSSKNNQREAKALAVRVLSSLVLLSALALLIARCALHIKNKKRSGIASRRLSDQVRLLQGARLDGRSFSCARANICILCPLQFFEQQRMSL